MKLLFLLCADIILGVFVNVEEGRIFGMATTDQVGPIQGIFTSYCLITGLLPHR